MLLTYEMKGFLLNMIKPSTNAKNLAKAEWAINIVERDRITEKEIEKLIKLGFKFEH